MSDASEPEIYVAGVDNGSRLIKVYFRCGEDSIAKTFKMDSFVNLGLASRVSVDEDLMNEFCSFNEKGEMAIFHVDASMPLPTTNYEYQFSPETRVLVHAALIKAGIPRGSKVKVCVGLPLGYYFNQIDWTPNLSLINEVKENIKAPVYEVLKGCNAEVSSSQSPLLDIVEVDVLSETYGAWLDDYLTIRQNNTISRNDEIKKQARAYVDLGGYTTDILVVSEGLIDKSSCSIPVGGNHLDAALKKFIAASTPGMLNAQNLSRQEYEKILEQGFIRQGAKKIDLASGIEGIRRDFFAKLERKIKDALGNHANFVEKIVFIGGLSEYFYDDYISKLFDSDIASLRHDPSFANARANWKKMYLTHRTSVRDKK